MAIDLKVPSAGESITEVMIGEWLVEEGAFVEEDESLVVIETDKVNQELPAPSAGRLVKILKQEGEDAAPGDVIGHFEPGEDDGAEDAPADAETAETRAEDDAVEEPVAESESGTEARVMPAAARLLADYGLAADEVKASGPGGRLLKEDVLAHVEATGAKAPETTGKSPSGETSKSAAKPAQKTETAQKAPPSGGSKEASGSSAAARTEEVVRMTPLRRRVAARLVEAQQTAALLTTFNEVDMSAVMALRKQYKEPFIEAHDIKLGFMSFFVKAVVEALKDVPQVNAEIRGDEIVYRNYQDIGVAVGGGKGLVVPILRNAERLSFAEVEKTIGELARKALDGKLALEDLQGGTFTISNGGVYGSLLSTPIVNPPQSGILGMHKIEDRPVAVNGEVVIRPMMYLALTYDHRIVDGREAVSFLVKIKERIEDPVRILLEV